MTQQLEKQVLIRLKRINCQQQNCRNNNQDNIDLIVFGQQNAKRSGLMCSQCLMDTQLLSQLKPIQKHCISLKKFMKTLTSKYKEYKELKDGVNWGPNIVDNQKSEIKELLNTYEQLLFKGTLEITKYIEDLQVQTLQEIKQLHKDLSYQKLSELLAQQDDQQQQKINISVQLKTITSNIMPIEGQYKMSNENQLKQKHELLMNKYRKSMRQAKQCYQQLIDVNKKAIKALIKVEGRYQ